MCDHYFAASLPQNRSGEIEIGEFKSWMSHNPKAGKLLMKKGGEEKLRRTSDSTQARVSSRARGLDTRAPPHKREYPTTSSCAWDTTTRTRRSLVRIGGLHARVHKYMHARLL